ncbi:hypothetical protein DM01DRAFT_243112, partial [Hesseltinella vesiculosa]
NVARNIAHYLPNYQQYIHSLKTDGYTIVGYARKSPSSEIDDDTRARNLQNMVTRLHERSHVDKVFVSWSSKAGDKIGTRDFGCNKIARLEKTSGTTQDLIAYLEGSETNCLVVLDFPGLSTDF